MANNELLAQLKDIHLPQPISWWPLAPGWYVLLALLLITIMFLVYRFYKRYRYALAKKKALVLLNTYQKEYEKKLHAPATSAHISELLRRVALVYYPREQVASLYGEAWLDFLNQTSSGIDCNSIREMLLEMPFKTEKHMNLEPLFQSAKLWIQQRSVPCSK